MDDGVGLKALIIQPSWPLIAWIPIPHNFLFILNLFCGPEHTFAMLVKRTLAAASLLAAAVVAQNSSDVLPPNSDGKYTVSARGIRANFIPYGASISNLFINDTNGVERDIVLGFDNASYYSIDRQHPHLGGVPGRYANRIKNSTFNIDGIDYHVDANENGGLDTLHGGSDGWDYVRLQDAKLNSNK